MADQPLRDVQRRWEARALGQGESLNSVLYRGLPEVVNAYIHERHRSVLHREFAPRLRTGARVLDLGCGYGRVGTALREARPDVELVGVDISRKFCALFCHRIGAPAVCADVANPPFAPGSFDGIIAVTSLMYVSAKDRGAAMERIVALLTPKGVALCVDGGQEYMSLAAKAKPSTTDSPTGGLWFTVREYDALGSAAGCEIVNRGGMPVFSLLLPLVLLVARAPALARGLLSVASRLDDMCPMIRRFSIHRWMVIERVDPG